MATLSEVKSSSRGFSTLDLPQRFGPKTQQGPYDIWAHPLHQDLAIVVSTDRTSSGGVEPGLGAIRSRMSALASNVVRGEMPVNTLAVLHPNVHIVEPLRREHRAKVTASEIKREIDPHAKRLADDLGRAGKRAEGLLRGAGYTAHEFVVRVGNKDGGQRAIGLGLLTPGTAVILNRQTGDPIQTTEEWEEMLFKMTGIEHTPYDSDPQSIQKAIGSIKSFSGEPRD